MSERELKKYDYTMYMDMEKKDLKKSTKGQLIKLLLKQKKSKKVSNHEDLFNNDPFKDDIAQEPAKRMKPPRTGKWESIKPKPVPCKSVNEDLILPPPEQFQDGYKPIPKPRTDRPLQIPKIKELNQALKGHAKSYGIELQDNLKPLNHFTKTKALVESHLENLLKDMKGFKFIEMLEITFGKKKVEKLDSINKIDTIVYKTAFFNGKVKNHY